MNAGRDEYRQRAQEPMLPTLLEMAKDENNEMHKHEIVDKIEEIVLGMLACGRREAAFEALRAMLLHPEDYVQEIAAREMVLLNDPSLDGALADALKRGDGHVLNALACGMREKAMREAVGEGVKDTRTQNDRESDAASFALMERFRNARAVSPDDLRRADAQLLEDAENDGEQSPNDTMWVRTNIMLLAAELCGAKLPAGGDFQKPQRERRPGHALAKAGNNVVRLHAVDNAEDARRIPR